MENIQEHKNFEKFVRSFTLDDSYRFNLNKPTCFNNGWVASTNAHKLLWFKDSNFINKQNVFNFENEEGVNALKVMEIFSNIYENQLPSIGKINLKEIEIIFSQIKKNPEYSKKYKVCEECDGNGTIECDCCGNESECKECDGNGEIECEKTETGYYLFPNDEYIQIVDNYFSLTEFSEILEYMDLINIKELDVHVTNNSMKSLFSIPNQNVYLLVMGVHHNSDFKKLHPIKIQ